MSLLNLISNLGSDEKSSILGQETTKILRYTFSQLDTDAVPSSIIDNAVLVKDGIRMLYNKRLRANLIESLSLGNLEALGFLGFDDAIKHYDQNIDDFFNHFNISKEYRLETVIDTREPSEIVEPIYGEVNGTNAFPHDYQKRLIDKAFEHIHGDSNKSMLITMPTGSGKTVLAMELIINLFRTNVLLHGNKLKIGWLVDKNELCEQSLQSFQKLWKQKGDHLVKASRFYDKFDRIEFSEMDEITFATFTLLSARKSDSEVVQFLTETDIVVIDEAHGANAYTYQEIVLRFNELNPKGRILGLTATPFRNDDNEYANLKGMFHKLLEIKDQNESEVSSPIEYLVEGGYLSKLHFEVLNASKQGNSNSEYYNQLHESVKNECEKIITRNENSIIFAESKSHAVALSVFLQMNGIDNKLIVGETPPPKRDEYLSRFGDSEDSLSFLVNHQILSTGIDVPGMNSIMILAKITSPSLALQILGRAMRGKKNGGNESNTIYLTKDNDTKLREFKILEKIVLKS
jgi:DNA repair protein RadD